MGAQVGHARNRSSSSSKSSRASVASVLVVIYGEARGDALLWSTQYKHLVLPLRADVAYFCGADCAAYGAFLNTARYVWTRREPSPGASWDTLIERRGDAGARAMAIARRMSADFAPQGWGLTRGARGAVRRGSGAASMETRQQLLEALRASGADAAYSYFVLTRPDYYFLCDHPAPAQLVAPGAKQVAVPRELIFKDDATYCNDRHAVLAASSLEAYLGVLELALQRSVLQSSLWTGLGGGEANIERLTASALHLAGAAVRRVPLPMFLARVSTDATRWSRGMWLFNTNLSLEQRNAVRAEYGHQPGRSPHDEQPKWRARVHAALAAHPAALLDLKQCVRLKMGETEVVGAAQACSFFAYPLT